MRCCARFIGLALILLGCEPEALGAKGTNRDFDWGSLTEMIPMPVYPFDALLHKKHGTVALECTVDPQGRLLHATVLKSDGPEFVGATLAYLEPMAFSVPAKAAKNSEGKPLISYEITFDESKCEGAHRLMTCPSDSAKRIVAALREDPTGKQFSRVKMLDEALVPIARAAPFFPLSLREKASTGSAVIEFYIDEDGRAVLPRIVSASDEAFGYAACQSINGWRFKPPLRGGKPTVVKVRTPVDFTLQ